MRAPIGPVAPIHAPSCRTFETSCLAYEYARALFFDFSFSNYWIFRKAFCSTTTTPPCRPIIIFANHHAPRAAPLALRFFRMNFLFCRPVSPRINQAFECKAVSRKAGEFLSSEPEILFLFSGQPCNGFASRNWGIGSNDDELQFWGGRCTLNLFWIYFSWFL